MRPRRRRGRGPRAHPDERALRVGERARRHVRPGRLPRLRARLRAVRVERQVGRAAGLPTPRRSLFDALCMLGLVLVGRRFGGTRLAATLAFAWAAYPFTHYASNSNTNDAILPAFLIWGFWLALLAVGARSRCIALAGWTKFAALLLAPLWLSYPTGGARRAPRFALGFAGATRRGVPRPPARARPLRRGARVRRPHVRVPARPRVAVLALGLGAVPRRGGSRPPPRPAGPAGRCSSPAPSLVAFVPRRKSPFQLAALTAALLIGFEIVLTHWFYLYIPWFFPFVAFAVLYRRGPSAPVH